ncbi:T9SS type A sorting domain-containing protein [Telluribacter sp. SYSU D00476]|uniref:Ig-like domain-containing protein n=1 Tax=Telluribacter sp. SYSU D00476 TaxID=2811430 RepID=UPI001FF67A68|nr:T9SS type A sorting domain-containing protein [Telluribacter sp. SYSU D00476]
MLFVSWLWAGQSLAQTTTPTITTGVPDKTVVCLGGTISVPFTTTGTFNTGNEFTVQLSDATGSFDHVYNLTPSGATTPLVVTIPTGLGIEAGTAYKVRVVSKEPLRVGTASTAVLTIQTAPAAPVVSSNVEYCQNAATSPLVAAGTDLKWYTTATGGTSTAIAPTPSSAASGVTSYYVTQSTSGGCESPRAQIDVTIKSAPAAPAVSQASYSYCVGQTATTLSATATSGNTLKWYQANDTPLAEAPTPSTASAGTITYKVSQVNSGNCESPKVTITITVGTVPAAPTATSPIEVCAGTTLTATGSNLRWYDSANNLLTEAPKPTSAGTYYVTQTSGGCESVKKAIVVTISPAPAAPAVAQATIGYCQGAPAQALSATATTGNTLRWYLPNGTFQATAPVPSTTTVGEQVYKVTQRNALGCESSSTEIKVTINAIPAAPTVVGTQVYCQTKVSQTFTLTASAAEGNTLRWYQAATGGTAGSAPVIDQINTSSRTYYVSQVTPEGCESPRAAISVQVNPLPASPTGTQEVVYCQFATATALKPTFLNGATANWYGTNATGGTRSSTAPVPSTQEGGVTSYYVSQTVNGCESDRVEIKVRINTTPLPTVSTREEYCQNATATPLAAQGDNLKWYTVATGGTASLIAPTPSTTRADSITFYVTQTKPFTVGTTSLNCESPRAKITVVVNPLPVRPTVTSVEECQTRQAQNITLAATGTTGNSFRWYTTASGGTGNNTAPTVNLLNADTTSYYVSQVTAKDCEGPRARLQVEIKRLPALPTVQPLIEYCQFVTASPLTATPETGATINWYGTNAIGGTASATAPVPSTQEGGTTSYYVSQTLRGCVGDRAEIKVRINTTPKPAVTTPVEYCQNTTASPLAAQGENLKWYRDAAATESQSNPFTPFTANVGTYSFYVTQTGSNRCESPKEEIRVRIKPLPSATISGDKAVSLGQSAEILVNFTGDGPWNYVLSNGLSGRTTQNPLRIQVSPQRTTTYLVTEVSNECGKGTPNGSAMVTVLIPTISTGNPTTASLCAGRTFTIPFQASGEFVASNKFNVQISLDTTDRNFYTIPTVQNGNEAVATVPDSTRGGNYFVRVVGESPQFILRGSISPVNVTVRPLPTATLTGTTTILIGETANLSVNLTGDGPWTFTFNTGQRDSLITTSVASHIVTVRPQTTTTYSIAAVSNQCGTGRASGTARVQVDPILGVEPVLNAQWLTVYPSPVQTLCVVDIEASLVAGAAQLRVYDANGRLVLEKPVSTTKTEVDFTQMNPGVYFIQVENGGRVAVRRIVKQD